MKKIFISSLMLALLLCGCQSGGNTDSSDFGDDLSKAQEIAVISSDESKVIETFAKKMKEVIAKDIGDGIRLLDYTH